MKEYKNPYPTVDIIIETTLEDGRSGIILIKRKFPPFGWALPGGFVEYGESMEAAAIREGKEETSLTLQLKYQLHTYSDPKRDPRKHTVTTVYVASATGTPEAKDDALEIGVYALDDIDFPLAFDHRQIIDDYLAHNSFFL